jgi:hypothetical protein
MIATPLKEIDRKLMAKAIVAQNQQSGVNQGVLTVLSSTDNRPSATKKK